MKITSLLFVMVTTACMAAGCSSSPGNDVVEDTCVEDPGGSDSAVADTAHGDDVVVHDGAGDGGFVDVVGPLDVTLPDLVLTDTVVDVGPVDISVDTSDDVVPVDVPADVEPSDAAGEITEPINIALNPKFSGCGGFDPVLRAEEDPYCGDERLNWEVASEDGVIHFTNTNVWLNCCGIHNVTVFVDDGVYVIREIDDPEEGGGRCDCMCMFDFAVDMPVVEASSIIVRIERLVTDGSNVPELVWQDSIDLTAGSGDILIEENVGWCAEAVNLGQNMQYSDCGGFLATRTDDDIRAETLDWSYDSDSGLLTLVNRDICLNCCGDHSMEVLLIDDLYVLVETDAPADGGGRCFCDCFFDYAVEIPSLIIGTIQLSITRNVTDSLSGVKQVWSGFIDLSGGSGSIVIFESGIACI